MFNIRKLAAALFARPAHRPQPLGFEQLEGRDVPAIFYWLGDHSEYFAHPGGQPPLGPGRNWVQAGADGNPPADPVAAPRPFAPPGMTDEARFVQLYGPTGAALPQKDCIWGEGGGVKALRALNGIAKTVKLNRDIGVETLDLQSGAIDQTAAANTLTVTKSMYWNGGVLDSTPATPSALILTGNTTVATILNRDGPGTTTLQTADTIRVEGARVDFGYGTLQFTAGTGLKVINGVANVVGEGTKKLALSKGAGDFAPSVEINNGYYTVSSPSMGPHTSELPFKIGGSIGGALTIKGGVDMKVTGRFPAGTVPDGQPSVIQTSGFTELTCGSTLDVVAGGFDLRGGRFTVFVNVPWSQADLKGNMRVTQFGAVATQVRFESANPGDCGTFHVEGNVNWDSGTYLATVGVNATGGAKACLWEATGQFVVGFIASVAADTFGAVAAGHNWLILKGQTGITFEPLEPNGYRLDLQNANTELKLTKL